MRAMAIRAMAIRATGRQRRRRARPGDRPNVPRKGLMVCCPRRPVVCCPWRPVVCCRKGGGGGSGRRKREWEEEEEGENVSDTRHAGDEEETCLDGAERGRRGEERGRTRGRGREEGEAGVDEEEGKRGNLYKRNNRIACMFFEECTEMYIVIKVWVG